ncbi:MAG: transcriptional repressor [Clostridia bacterium]|nr:transcriptional repressor [Clostridia bacterium]
MKDLLRDTGMRWTRQRQLIYDEILRRKGHFSAEVIWKKLTTRHPGMGLSTIYRTLQLLEDKKIIKRIPIAGETTIYECEDGTPHGHHHIFCTECGKTIEMHVDMLDSIEEIVMEKYGFEISGHTVMFNGICPECRARLKSDPGDDEPENNPLP